MPGQKWTTETELKLLLTIIEVTDPKPPSWNVIATAMGSGFTTEAVRQKFGNIKKGVKSTLHSSSSSSTPASTPTKPTKATATTTTPTSKGKANPATNKKRKAPAVFDMADDDDDEEEEKLDLTAPTAASKKKIKAEPLAERVEVFKTEALDGGVDVENEDLYDDGQAV